MATETVKVEDLYADVMKHASRWENPVQETIKRVRTHPTVSFEGMEFRVVTDRKIQEGDFYLTGRNLIDGVRFMEVSTVDWENGWVIPTPFGYAFGYWECVIVEPVE